MFPHDFALNIRQKFLLFFPQPYHAWFHCRHDNHKCVLLLQADKPPQHFPPQTLGKDRKFPALPESYCILPKRHKTALSAYKSVLCAKRQCPHIGCNIYLINLQSTHRCKRLDSFGINQHRDTRNESPPRLANRRVQARCSYNRCLSITQSAFPYLFASNLPFSFSQVHRITVFPDSVQSLTSAQRYLIGIYPLLSNNYFCSSAAFSLKAVCTP